MEQLTDGQLWRLALKLWFRYAEGDPYGWDWRTIGQPRRDAWTRVMREMAHRKIYPF